MMHIESVACPGRTRTPQPAMRFTIFLLLCHNRMLVSCVCRCLEAGLALKSAPQHRAPMAAMAPLGRAAAALLATLNRGYCWWMRERLVLRAARQQAVALLLVLVVLLLVVEPQHQHHCCWRSSGQWMRCACVT